MSDFDLLGDPIEEPRETRGRPKHSPEDQMKDLVLQLTGCGVPQEDIARIIRIDATTLRERYRDELDRGAAVANAKVAGNLFMMANGTGREALTAAIFWLKCRAGWRETAPQSPDWTPIRERSLGKKEQAMADAATAGQGSPEWGDDLRPTRLN